MRIPHIKSVMTPFPFSVEAGSCLEDARRQMEEHDIHHLPVTRGARPVGLISASELRRAEREAGAAGAAAVEVGQVCSREIYVVELEEPLDNVLLHMARERIGSTLVVREGRLAGIFTTVDACRLFAEHLRRDQSVGGDDAA